MKIGCVLQVEDDENDVYLLQHCFKQAQIAIMHKAVRDGQESIDYFSGVGKYADRTEFPLPWLVLLDLKMPRKNGFEVLKWVRAQSEPVIKLLPVIIWSSSANESDVTAAYQLGANAYIVKPSDLDSLLELVMSLNTFWVRYSRVPLQPRYSDE